MAVANPHFAALTGQDLQTVHFWIEEFARSWKDGCLAGRVRQLPPQGHRLRLPALIELVKVDLQRQWQKNRPVTVEGYLKAYPELGTPDTVAADLIQAEYEARREGGAAAPLTAFIKRFPRQAGEVRRLIEQVEKSDTISTKRPDVTAGPAAAAAPPRPLESPKTLPEQFGRYRIIRKLGKGGMGTVYLAHDDQLDRLVALKVPNISSGDGPQYFQRFFREARAAATIEHPNICPVYDAGEINGIPYLSMAYVEGKSLRDLIQPNQALPQVQAALLVQKVAQAMAEAHARGVIHRDLKPVNIMINQRREPVIMDFGLARRDCTADERLTQSGAMMGTPVYMPPEQFAGDVRSMGPASDIYSLGVILYELLAGRPPFRGSLEALMGQIMTQEPPPASQFRPDLDPSLAAICRKAMAKKVADRYGSMAEMANALSVFLRRHSPGTEPAPLAPVPAAVPAPGPGPQEATTVTVEGGVQPTIPVAVAGPPGADGPPPRRRRLVKWSVGTCLAVVPLAVLFVLWKFAWTGTEKKEDADKKKEVAQTGTKKKVGKDGTKKKGKPARRKKKTAVVPKILEQEPRPEHVDYDKAIADYTKAIQLEPENGANFNNRGLAYHSKGDFALAVTDFTQAIRLVPNNAIIYTNRGHAHLKKGDIASASADFTKALLIDVKYSRAYSGLGQAYAKKKDYPSAVKQYTKAIALKPDNRWDFNARGDAYFNNKQYPHAIQDYNKALAFPDPLTPADGALLYTNRGYGYLRSGDWQKAIKDFSEAIRIDKSYPDGHAGRAEAHNGAGNYEEAVKDFENAIELQGDNGWHYYGLGQVYFSKKDYTKAIDAFTLALARKKKPNEAWIYTRRGFAVYRRNKKDGDKALRDYEAAVGADAKYYLAFRRLAEVYHDKKDYDKAIANYTQAIELAVGPEVTSGVDYFNRGDAYYSKKEYDKAIADYTGALNCPLKPNEQKVVYTSRGFAQMNKNNLDEAIKDFDRAIDLDPKYVLAYKARGNAYKKKGDLKKAAEDEKRAQNLTKEK